MPARDPAPAGPSCCLCAGCQCARRCGPPASRALHACHACLHAPRHSPELAQAVIDSGALDSLVTCLEEFDPGVKEAATWCLGYVAGHNAELAQQVVDAGGQAEKDGWGRMTSPQHGQLAWSCSCCAAVACVGRCGSCMLCDSERADTDACCVCTCVHVLAQAPSRCWCCACRSQSSALSAWQQARCQTSQNTRPSWRRWWWTRAPCRTWRPCLSTRMPSSSARCGVQGNSHHPVRLQQAAQM